MTLADFISSRLAQTCQTVSADRVMYTGSTVSTNASKSIEKFEVPWFWRCRIDPILKPQKIFEISGVFLRSQNIAKVSMFYQQVLRKKSKEYIVHTISELESRSGPGGVGIGRCRCRGTQCLFLPQIEVLPLPLKLT